MSSPLYLKPDEKYLSWLSWSVVLFIAFTAFRKFPLHSLYVGDEMAYITEVNYLARYGVYKSLAQGTSFFYSSLIFLCSKLFFTSFLITGRVLSGLFFIVCCKLLLKCLSLFTNIDYRVKYFGIIYFAIISSGWLCKALPDVVSTAFLLAAFYFVARSGNYKFILLSALLVFVGFAIKPVVLFGLPGLSLLLFFKDVRRNTLIRNGGRVALFLIIFIACFSIYHIPGYTSYHRLMLEDKNHYYQDDQRIENKISWGELNVYFESYNIHNKPNKWAVTFDEVDSFEREHPNINLNISYTQYLRSNWSEWLKKLSGKVFLEMTYFTQRGLFFAKWTSVNRVIKNIIIIKIMTFLIFLFFFISERSFIKDNCLLFVTPFLFFLGLAVYNIPQLEDNWLLFSLPFLALPVLKFLTRYINAYILVLLQLVYFLIM